MHMNKELLRILWVAIAALPLLAACGSSPPVNYYSLEILESDFRRDSDGALLIGVGPLRTPDYLSRSRIVTRGDKSIDLQPREYRLLEYLMSNAVRVVTRTMLLEQVWDYYFDPQTNVIDVHISRLRAKIDRGYDRPLLHTVRGAGYMLSADG